MSPSADNIVCECGKAYDTRNKCLIASVINLLCKWQDSMKYLIAERNSQVNFPLKNYWLYTVNTLAAEYQKNQYCDYLFFWMKKVLFCV